LFQTGKEVFNHSILVFTRLDDIEFENKNINELIRESSSFKECINKFNGNFLSINNKCSNQDDFRESFVNFLCKSSIYPSLEIEASIKLYEKRKIEKHKEKTKLSLLKQQYESQTILFQRWNREINEEHAIQSKL